MLVFLRREETRKRGEKERMDVENDRVERKRRRDNFVDVDVEAKTEGGCFLARKTMMVTPGICKLMSFSASPHERLALQVIPGYSQNTFCDPR